MEVYAVGIYEAKNKTAGRSYLLLNIDAYMEKYDNTGINCEISIGKSIRATKLVSESDLKSAMKAGRIKVENLVYVKSGEYIKGKHYSLSELPKLAVTTDNSKEDMLVLKVINNSVAIVARINYYMCRVFKVEIGNRELAKAINQGQGGSFKCKHETIIENDKLDKDIAYLKQTVGNKNVVWTTEQFEMYMRHMRYSYELYGRMGSLTLSNVDIECKILHIPFGVTTLIGLYNKKPYNDTVIIASSTVNDIQTLCMEMTENITLKSILFQDCKKTTYSVMHAGGLRNLEITDKAELPSFDAIKDAYTYCEINSLEKNDCNMSLLERSFNNTECSNIKLHGSIASVKYCFWEVGESVIELDARSIQSSLRCLTKTKVKLKMCSHYNEGQYTTSTVNEYVEKCFVRVEDSDIHIGFTHMGKSTGKVKSIYRLDNSFNQVVNTNLQIDLRKDIMLDTMVSCLEVCNGLSGIVKDNVLTLPACARVIRCVRDINSGSLKRVLLDYRKYGDLYEKSETCEYPYLNGKIEVETVLMLHSSSFVSTIVDGSVLVHKGAIPRIKIESDIDIRCIHNFNRQADLNELTDSVDGLYNNAVCDLKNLNLPKTVEELDVELYGVMVFDSQYIPNVHRLGNILMDNLFLTRLILDDNIEELDDEFRLSSKKLDAVILGKGLKNIPSSFILELASGRMPRVYVVKGSKAEEILKDLIQDNRILAYMVSSVSEAREILDREDKERQLLAAKISMLKSRNSVYENVEDKHVGSIVLVHKLVNRAKIREEQGLNAVLQTIDATLDRGKFINEKAKDFKQLYEKLGVYNRSTDAVNDNSRNYKNIKSIEGDYSSAVINLVNMITNNSDKSKPAKILDIEPGSKNKVLSIHNKITDSGMSLGFGGGLSVYKISVKEIVNRVAADSKEYYMITEGKEESEVIRYIAEYKSYKDIVYNVYSEYEVDKRAVGLSDILQKGDYIEITAGYENEDEHEPQFILNKIDCVINRSEVLSDWKNYIYVGLKALKKLSAEVLWSKKIKGKNHDYGGGGACVE